MFTLAEKYKGNKEMRKANAARGERDVIYLNRTFFGLYSILSKLNAKIKISKGKGFELL